MPLRTVRSTAISLIVLFSTATHSQPTFQNIGLEVGVGEWGRVAVSWLDVNNDFAPDILTQSGLYIQTATGRFEKSRSPVGTQNFYTSAAADFDNDGDIDLYVPGFFSRPLFFMNSGDGTFKNVTDSLGVSFDAPQNDQFPTGISLLDIDNDGDLDMFVGNERGRDTMFRNDGIFVDITEQVGMESLGGSRYSIVGDVDNDGLVDLFVGRSKRTDIPEALHNVPSALYHNNGDGTFTDIGVQAGISQSPRDISGLAFFDYNNDGWLDLLMPSRDNLPTLLYRNDGDGTFTETGTAAGVAIPSENGNAAVADFDNDGWVDIFLADTGAILPDLLFRNNGNGTFTEIGSQANVAGLAATTRVAAADYDSDGYADLFLINASSREILFRNQGGSNHWLAIDMVGVESNRSAIGTRVVMEANGLSMIQDVTSGNGYGSKSVLTRFGLGTAIQADRIEVHWPSGQVDILTDIPADQNIRVIEGTGGYHAFTRTTFAHDFPVSEQIGNPFTLSADLSSSLFDKQSRLNRVFLTGLEDAPINLVATSSNPFAFSTPINITGKLGFRELTFHVEETTSIGTHTAVFRYQIDVLPAKPSQIRLASETVVIGDVEVNRRSTVVTSLHNDGEGPLTVSEIRSDLDGFSVPNLPLILRPGDSTNVTIHSTPSETGAFEGIVEVVSNDPNAETVTFVISGTAIFIPGDARADFDGSGQVDFTDFLAFAEAFGTVNVAFDIDARGSVDFADFLVFAESFGKSVG